MNELDLFELFIEYEKKRLYKLMIALEFISYLTKINRLPNLIALEEKNPLPKNSQEEQKNDTIKSIEELLTKVSADDLEEQAIEIVEEKEIDINSNIINNLIRKFLKLFYLKKKSELNNRAKNSHDKVHGYYYWDKKQVARHLVSKNYTKILNDKYDMEYGTGKKESIPLAFYFDLSGSMTKYTDILARISISLLQNNIKVLIGGNNIIYYQINDMRKNTTYEEFKNFLNGKTKITENPMFLPLDQYLISANCERCVIFSDEDSYREVCNLSKNCEVYLLYASNYGKGVDENFKGVYFDIANEQDLMHSLNEMAHKSYRVLKDKNRQIRRK